MEETIKKLEYVVETYKDDPSKKSQVDKARKTIARLKGETVEEETKTEDVDSDCPDAIMDALEQIEKALKLIEDGGAGIDENELDKILNKWRVNIPNLGEDVLSLIESEKTVRFEDIPTGKIIDVGNVPPLFYKVVSDLKARNNVYLYGGAGTGKTYIAQVIANALNCTLIEINCNQYTSPLELQGGQTIDGYQQGKLITAYANLKSDPLEGVVGGMEEGKTGCLLLLDELPKIDPNTAGILNSALAKVKDPKERSAIEDARGRKFERGNFYCIATGNIQLNKESTDYVANFQQDLSLQDRFVGSTYEVIMDVPLMLSLMELRGADGTIQKYTFIFNYCMRVKNLIESPEGENRGLGSQAFISIRIMQSLRDSWIFWYKNHKETPQTKTLQEGIISFLGLFDDEGRKWLEENSNMKAFFAEIDMMASQPLGSVTQVQTKEANDLVQQYRNSVKAKMGS